MMALSKKMLEQEPSEIEMLLPWHAAGTLNARDARRVPRQQHLDITWLLLQHFLAQCHHGQPRSTPAAFSSSASFLRA